MQGNSLGAVPDNQSALNELLSAAVGVFEKRINDYDAWYYKQDRVSLAIIAERESLVDKCQWAIEELKKAQGR